MLRMNIAIVGIGPHFRRTYMQYLDKYCICPRLLIELDSEKENVNNILSEKKWDNTVLFTIPDDCKNETILPEQYRSRLDRICKEQSITHAIISTEPKGHLMYLNFFMEKGINTLTDKPLVCFDDMLDITNVEKVKNTFKHFLKADNDVVSKILCQRNHHRGYEFVRELVSKTIKAYNIPITYVSVYSCDGNWVMPHDLDYENHPYKYGYGKTFHSGYHFIDLLVSLLRLNNCATDEKHIVKTKMYNSFITPDDEMDIINLSDYKRFFGKETFPSYYHKSSFDYSKYGEKDIFSQFEFYNNKNRVITIANLNILESGFSRRGWLNTKVDRYKGNGRVRHESVNIQIGPLLNIQVHSYQSKEIKDRAGYEFDYGGLDHFDIDIYRNVDVIGGKPYERIRSTDFHDFSYEKHFIGLNELGREESISAFLSSKKDANDLINHKDSMELLYQLSKSYYCYRTNAEESRIRTFAYELHDIV